MSSKTEASEPGKEATPALVPKLRFPEFRNSEGWKEVALGEIADVKLGKMLDKQKHTTGRLHPYLNNISVRWNHVDTSNLPQMFFGDAELDRFGLRAGDVVVCEGGEPGRAAVWDGRLPGLKFQKAIHRVRFKIPFQPRLLVLHLENLAGSTRFNSLFTGGGIKHLTGETFARLKVPLVPLAEQKKIAECLSSVDELMAAQARKVDALKTHKKGVMQQLFPREGETQPRLRFPEFKNAGVWEVKRLEQIGRVIRGASPRPKGDPRYYGGPVPRLMVQDVTRDGKWVTPQIDSLTEEGARLSRPCPAGTLTIVCSGSVGVVSFLAVDACIHDGFLALVDIDESIATKDFLFHTLSTLREQFEKGATHGGVFTNLTTTGIDLFEIKRPGIPEQQRIATCLSSLDALITAETQKLEALKTHKKGLMQQLFPPPKEVEA